VAAPIPEDAPVIRRTGLLMVVLVWSQKRQ